MYATLIPSIKDTIAAVPAVKEVHPYPLPGNPKQYPAVIFFPDSFENSFETVAENRKIYRFKMWVVTDLAGTTEEAAFTSILPNAVDKITAKFDEAWNGGAIDGHRVWYVLDTGFWGLAEENSGKRAFAEMTLTVQLLTTN